MAEVVALDMAGGPAFVDALRRIWDAGDAVLPLDPRTPRTARDALIAALSPTCIVEDDGELRRLDEGRPTEAGDALVIATSGSTGAPKGVVLTHDALEYAAYASATYLGLDAATTWLACLPLSHIGGFSVITRALLTGAGLVVHPGFDASAVEQAARAGATEVSLVPTALRRIDTSLFRRILLGGSQIPPDRPANTVATYGMTESGAGVVYDGLALNGVGMRIDQSGTIALRGPTMLRCYRDGTVPLDAEGWFTTGDLGTIDRGTGRLTVHGRADDLIITGGEKVWPEPVEVVVRGVDGVADAAIVGRPDPEWGQVVVALVVPADPASPPTLDAVRDAVKERLAAFHAPKVIEMRTTLPRTALGKLRRGELR